MPDGLQPLLLPQLPERVRRPQRSSADGDARLRRRIVGAVLLAHVLLGVMLDRAMQIRATAPVAVVDDGVLIRWIDAEPVEEVPAVELSPASMSADPAAVPASAPVLSQPTITATPARTAVPMAAPRAIDGTSIAPAAPIDTARLFNPDGSVRMSTQVVDAAKPAPAQPEFDTPSLQKLAPLRSPIPYRRTQFDAVWVPDGENLPDEIFRNVTVEKEIETPWGTRWRCVWILIIGACADVPPPLIRNAPRAAWETYQPEPEDPDREIDF